MVKGCMKVYCESTQSSRTNLKHKDTTRTELLVGLHLVVLLHLGLDLRVPLRRLAVGLLRVVATIERKHVLGHLATAGLLELRVEVLCWRCRCWCKNGLSW